MDKKSLLGPGSLLVLTHMTIEDAGTWIPRGGQIVEIEGQKYFYGRMTVFGSYFAKMALIPIKARGPSGG